MVFVDRHKALRQTKKGAIIAEKQGFPMDYVWANPAFSRG
jgi:hypothetical protein